MNQHPAVVLFDSGASHLFMSQIFASKHDQRVVTIDKGGYCISVVENNISTNQIVRDVCISIRNREYTSVGDRCNIGYEMDEWPWSSH